MTIKTQWRVDKKSTTDNDDCTGIVIWGKDGPGHGRVAVVFGETSEVSDLEEARVLAKDVAMLQNLYHYRLSVSDLKNKPEKCKKIDNDKNFK